MGIMAILGGVFSGIGRAMKGADATGGGKKRGAVDAVRTAATIIDNLYTTEEERLDRATALARVLSEADALQAEVNKVEAGSRSLLVAGWRPFIGWVCGIALGWHFLIQPVLIFTLESLGHPATNWPVFDLSTLDTILFGILGLGTLRSAEKAAGKAL